MTCPSIMPATPVMMLHCWDVNTAGRIARCPLVGFWSRQLSNTLNEAVTNGLIYSTFIIADRLPFQHGSGSWNSQENALRCPHQRGPGFTDLQSISFCSDSSTFSGWNGLTMKSRAPADMASMTMFFWPMAVHMITLALASSFLISRTALMPSISGIVMSIVTRSGFNARYISTDSRPLVASPATSYPLLVRIFFSVTRMNNASSVIRTRLATSIPPPRCLSLTGAGRLPIPFRAPTAGAATAGRSLLFCIEKGHLDLQPQFSIVMDAFGSSQEQNAPRSQSITKPHEQPVLRVICEIDDHIPADDQIESLL